jgi:dolichol-phosphate mannosyltransferase
MPHLSVVIPCYNEQDSLPELYNRVAAACSSQVGGDYEIVLINDGSRDRTWAMISELARQDHRVVGIDLSRNHGHQLALTAGLSLCRGERILIIDADLQDPPELLPDMWALMDQGADVVYGQRAKRAGETWFKMMTAAAFYRLLRALTDIEIPLDTGDFRLMSRRVLDIFKSMPEQHRFVRGMVSWIGFKQVPLSYDRAERFAGTTKYPLRKMVNFAFDALTSFSGQPLRLGIYLAIGLLCLCGGLMAVTLVSWLFQHTIHGWTSLMAVVLLLGSVQTLMLGVIGEYVGRIYIQSKQRPLFLIRSVLNRSFD